VAAVGVSGALAVVAWLALDEILKEMSTVADEATTALKLGVWPIALRMIRDFPAVGIGRGAFATTFTAYKLEPIHRTFTHVENEWLQLPLEMGLVAGSASSPSSHGVHRGGASPRPLAAARWRPRAGALAAHNVFDFSLEVPGVAIPFAIVLGIAAREMPRVEIRPWLVRAAAIAGSPSGSRAHRARLARSRTMRRLPRTLRRATRRWPARDALRWHPADYVPPPPRARGSSSRTDAARRRALARPRDDAEPDRAGAAPRRGALPAARTRGAREARVPPCVLVR
jgi:hypothetical protein